jgi:hypothetical protein
MEIGDRVLVESEKVGVEPRQGLVTEVHGSTVQVRWDDGHETMFVPAAGSMRVEAAVEAKGPGSVIKSEVRP